LLESDVRQVDSLSELFLRILEFSHKYTGNYGWDIIILTGLIRVVLLPLTLSSLRGMKAMQQAQPQLKELQAKYKDDKEKLNKEMMALYKEIGFNPITGCLPMILQIPIFIILYRVLLFPEMNGFIFVNTSFYGMDLTTAAFNRLSTDFLGNMHLIMPGMIDLTRLGIGFFKNTYLYIPGLPVVVLMVITTVLQQQMMTVDPQQKTTMWMMNLFFVYLAFIMPSGVLLYWGFSNLLQFAQQAMTKTSKKAQAIAAKAAAEKSGGGKKQDVPKSRKKEQEQSDIITDKTAKKLKEKYEQESEEEDSEESEKKTGATPQLGTRKKTYPARKNKAGKSKKRKKKK
jgi:YidC/Oxa1 family membrane protein insertase